VDGKHYTLFEYQVNAGFPVSAFVLAALRSFEDV
jgi:hypothetical protein